MNADIEKEDLNNYNLIRKFLLHQLDSKTSLEVEEKFFCDPTFQDSVLMTEEELMEDYALKRLTSDELVRVQKYLLSSQTQLNKLRSIEEIINEVASFSEEPPPVNNSLSMINLIKKGVIEKNHNAYVLFSKRLVFYPLLILLILLGCSLAVFIYISRENSNSALAKRIEQLNSKNTDAVEILPQSIFEISPNLVRGSAAAENQVVIKPEDKTIEYHLVVTQKQYQTYQVSLREFNNQPLITLKDLYLSEENGARFLKIKFPAEIFKEDYYVFDVTGMTKDNKLEEMDSFAFKVVSSH